MAGTSAVLDGDEAAVAARVRSAGQGVRDRTATGSGRGGGSAP